MDARVSGGNELHVIRPEPHQRAEARDCFFAFIGAGGGVSLHYGVLHGDRDLRIAVLHQLDVCAGRVRGFRAGLIAPFAQGSGKSASNGVVNAGGGAGSDCDKLFGALSFAEQGNAIGRGACGILRGVRGLFSTAGRHANDHADCKEQSE